MSLHLRIHNFRGCLAEIHAKSINTFVVALEKGINIANMRVILSIPYTRYDTDRQSPIFRKK